MGSGVQMYMAFLIQGLDLCTGADGGGWWLDAARLEQAKYEEQHSTVQNSLGGPSWRLVLFYCFVVSLFPSGFRGSELQGWKIIHPNHSSHNTLCKHLWLQTPLQQWVGGRKFIIVTKSASC